jgi:hypothetical protein
MKNRLIIKNKILWGLLFLSLLTLNGCTTAPPKTTSNACSIITEYPNWYYDALDSYKKWGVPISVQFAIIRAESSFKADAMPQRTYALGFIPWKRPTTAYGYAQAVDETWDWYMKSTGNRGASRTSFKDSTDFVGWYGSYIARTAKISKSDAYRMYLAYWSGVNGYLNGNYKSNKAIISRAKQVQSWAWQYSRQLRQCDIPSRGWSSWLF